MSAADLRIADPALVLREQPRAPLGIPARSHGEGFEDDIHRARCSRVREHVHGDVCDGRVFIAGGVTTGIGLIGCATIGWGRTRLRCLNMPSM